MNVLTIAWSMCAAACGLMALLHLLTWLHNRNQPVTLLAVAMSAAAAVNGFIELAQVTSTTVDGYGALLVWQNLAVFAIVVSMVWYVRWRYHAGRLWMGLTITALWSVALVINFLSPHSVTFEAVDSLRIVYTSWGEQFSVPEGVVHDWKWVADLPSWLLIAYTSDAAWQLWRRGEHRRSWLMISMVLFILVGAVQSWLVDAGVLVTPYMISFAFLAIVLAFAWDMVTDAVATASTAHELAAHQRRWRALLANIDLAVLSVDVDGRIEYANPFLVALSGHPRDELLGRHADVLEVRRAASGIKARLDLARSREELPVARRELRCASGAVRLLDWTAVTLRNEAQELSGLVEVGTDVTERLRDQDELDASRNEMERLTRINLLGELASGMAHELNQPLTAILANAQAGRRLMSRDPSDTVQIREILEDIVADAARAGDVIHGLRRMLQTGELRSEVVSVNGAIGDAVRLAKGELDIQHCNIQQVLDESNPSVRAGRVELQQVLMNLLWNAMQALRGANQAGPLIVVRSRREGDWVEIDVEDNGPGVNETERERIFTPFFSTKSSGMGLGLGICRRIMASFGGTVQVRDVPGSGARFTLRLPAEMHDDEEIAA